jgi:predicted Fe-Mo cluster-binding NifX family protein
MIVCVPTEGERGMDEAVSGHFGRAKTYTLFDTTTNGVRVIENNGERKGAKGSASEHLVKENVEAVLAGKLGAEAIARLKKNGIWVYVGAEGTVLDTITRWRNGRLQHATVDNASEDS